MEYQIASSLIMAANTAYRIYTFDALIFFPFAKLRITCVLVEFKIQLNFKTKMMIYNNLGLYLVHCKRAHENTKFHLCKSRPYSYRAPVAQLVEHRAVTREVVSSTPARTTSRVFK